MRTIKIIFIGVFVLILTSACRKKKIDENLNGTWILSELIIDSYNEVTSNTSISIEFSNVEKGEGVITLISKDNQGTYYTVGSLKIDKKYENMTATFVESGWTTIYDGKFTVDESSFELIGTHSDSGGDNLTLKIKGFR